MYVFADLNVGYMSNWGKLMGRVLVTNYRLRFEGLENAGMVRDSSGGMIV